MSAEIFHVWSWFRSKLFWEGMQKKNNSAVFELEQKCYFNYKENSDNFLGL